MSFNGWEENALVCLQLLTDPKNRTLATSLWRAGPDLWDATAAHDRPACESWVQRNLAAILTSSPCLSRLSPCTLGLLSVTLFWLSSPSSSTSSVIASFGVDPILGKEFFYKLLDDEREIWISDFCALVTKALLVHLLHCEAGLKLCE
jgi:hypothetical protein